MATPKFVHKLRQKPVHVRERLLLVAMAVVTPFVLTLWYSTFKLATAAPGDSTIDNIRNTVTKASNNPELTSVFGTAEAQPASAIQSGAGSDTPAKLAPASGTEGTATDTDSTSDTTDSTNPFSSSDNSTISNQ